MEKLEGQIEHVLGVLDRVANNQADLDSAMAHLADAMAESHIRSTEQYKRTQEQFRETDQHLRETDERLRRATLELDARIDKLVSGIGEFIGRQSGSKAN